MKIVVIGSISAGVSGARKISAGDPNAQVTVYERGAFYSCGTGGLPHYLGEPIQALNEAIGQKEAELSREGIQARLLHEVQAIDAKNKTITVKDLTTGRVFYDHYDKLVVATGASNALPQVPGANRVGVQTLKTVEDLVFLKEYTRTPYVQDIVILGSSWNALEIAKVLLKMGRKVRIIDSARQLLPEFDADVSAQIQKQLEAEGVQFSLGEEVRAFLGKTFVETVQTTRGKYPCDLCIVEMGTTPNTAILAGTGVQLASNGAVVIDAQLATSVPGIYAVGDCVVCKDGSLRTCSLRVGGTELARTGLTESEAKKAGLRVRSVTATGNDRPGICPNQQQITIKLVYEANTHQILGAQAWGGKNVATRINAIAVAIRGGMTAEVLGQVDFCYSSAQCSIWDPVSLVCGMVK